MRICTVIIAALIGLPMFSLSAEAEGQSNQVIRVQDSAGNVRNLICRPAEPGELATSPASPVISSTPAVPAAVPYPPDARATPTAASQIFSPPQSTQNQVATATSPRRLFADPNDINRAWAYFAPRKHAFAPRGVQGMDPALHGPLPALKRAATTTASRSTPRPAASAVAPAPATTQVAGQITAQMTGQVTGQITGQVTDAITGQATDQAGQSR